MSLYIDLTITDSGPGPLLGVAVTRQTSLDGPDTAADAVNTYRWVYYRDGQQVIGSVQHRYGDGAVVLAAKVLAAVASYQAASRCDCGNEADLSWCADTCARRRSVVT